MSRRRSKKAEKRPSLVRRWQAWWSSQRPQLRPLRREAIGAGLVVPLAVLTLLGLLGISTGSVLGWWASSLRRLFGWSAFLVALALLGLGIWLLWQSLRERFPITPASVIGAELLLLVVPTASHMPLVLNQGAEEALLAAQQGMAGGYVGWALSVLLVEALGAMVGGFVLLSGLIGGLLLLLPVSWAEIQDWGQGQARRASAALNRWWTARQGTPVAPEPPDVPWWERDPDPSQARQAQRKRASAKQRAGKSAQHRWQPEDRSLPPLDLLDPVPPQASGETDVRRKTQIIEETLESFGVPARVVEIHRGPAVTQFGLDPGYIERRGANGQVERQRVRVGRIASLVDDLALALAAAPVRIEAPVPGKSVVGLEVPNEVVSLVSLRQLMESSEFKDINSGLAIALGKNVSGRPVAVDLSLMPHLLIAGATGSGKSVCMNAIICCLLFNNTPAELQMLMVDPKMVELTNYNDIPHLVAPVVVDAQEVVNALAWATRQMDARYKLFNQVGVRNLETYNRWSAHRKDQHPLPTLVVLIDELADLMMVAPDEVERHVCRLAQMGRATGIHLVIATQRPSVDVVTGLIKANFPARISFAVTSQIDSRVILDQPGAEKLLGRGDMLFMSPHQAATIRVQGCFVADKEIERLTTYWRTQEREAGQPSLFPPWTALEGQGEADSLLQEAALLARGRDRISTSFVQRQLRIGFPRAARLMEQMEEQGFVGPDEGGGRGRKVLIDSAVDLEEIRERLPGAEPK